MKASDLSQARVLRGAGEVYRSYGRNPTQLAAFHGITAENAAKIAPQILRGKQPHIPDDWLYEYLLLYGGVRSGKTHAAAFRAWISAMFFPGNEILIVRKRKEQLRNTFLNEFEKVGEAISDGNLKLIGEMQPERDGALEYRVFTKHPKYHSKIIFAIEPDGTDEEVIERFKGYTVGGAITEETSQLKMVTPQQCRIRVSLAKDKTGQAIPQWMLSITNPVYKGHPLQEFKQMCETTFAMGGRPPALVIRSRPADNAHNLPVGYVEAQTAALENDPVRLRMWIEGEDGLNIQGKPVFGSQWSRMHVDPFIRFNPLRPLIRGWDFGYHHPACIFLQEDDKGCINVLTEMLGRDETAEQFGDRVLATTAQFYGNAPEIYDYGDPAGAQKTDKGDTTIAILLRKGIRINFRPTGIDAGIIHIRNMLTRMRAGRPELCFSPACSDLIIAMSRGYHYAQFKDNTFSAKPKKDGYFDHLVDALRYALVNVRALPYAETSDLTYGPDRGKPRIAQGPEPFGAD